MPLALDDLRKTTAMNRRTKQRTVTPTLLGPDATGLAGQVVNYYAGLANGGQRQRDFSEQRLTELAGGDFKLARGLITAMLGFYVWETESFGERLDGEDWQRLQEYGLPNSSALRLALYDYLSLGDRPGYAAGPERAEALELFAAGLGLEPALVEELLFLDAEEQALLRLRRRNDGQPFRPPSAGELVRRYNRLAVETLLCNSSEVVFNFGEKLPGALVKRVGYLSRELHIPYDLDYTAAGEIQLRLFGPVQAFGSATRQGDRLARLAFQTVALARQTLPAARRSQAAAGLEYTGPRTALLDAPAAGPKKSQPEDEAGESSGFRSAVAVVHIRDKEYLYDLAAHARYLAPYDPDEPEAVEDGPEVAAGEAGAARREVREAGVSYDVRPAEPLAGRSQVQTPAKARDAAGQQFDSQVEARFYAEFAALAREGHTAGWQIEREPEAVAVPSRNLLFIPDFGLRRGEDRVWLEVIGFWTPGYRARKLEKLEKLKVDGGHRLLLAVAAELKHDFTHDERQQPHEPPFPAVFYKNSLRATDVLALLQQQYDDPAGRLNQVETARAGLVAELDRTGYVGEEALYRRLKVYNRTELGQALARLDLAGHYLDGYGLCRPGYLARAAEILRRALSGGAGRLSPAEAVERLQSDGFELDVSRAEALLEGLPGLRVVRPSLFEVYLQPQEAPVEEQLAAGPAKSRRARK